MTDGVRRGLMAAAVLGTVTSLAAGLAGATVDARTPGPVPTTPSPALLQAVTCQGPAPATSARVPVLLVHGTGLSAGENWGSTYQPALVARGHAVCTVSLPAYATGDVQTSLEYVASAIRVVARRAGRPIAVLGHSQGAYLPRAALRVWPDLAPLVDDVIGLAGVYDAGSAGLVARCRVSCVPALHQLATGSRLLTALGRRPLPAGPSYTNVGSDHDLTATPQPVANQQPGALAVAIEDACTSPEAPQPAPGNMHAMIVGDATAFALVTDALDHEGPTSPARAPATTCGTTYDGFDAAPFLAASPLIARRVRDGVPAEPALRCYLRPACADVDARGRLLRASRVTVSGTTLTWRATAITAGQVRLRLAHRSVVRTVRPGPVTVRLRAPRRSQMIRVETRPRYFTAWAREASHRS